MKKIIVTDREGAKAFRSSSPFAVISFVGSRHHRTPPKLCRAHALLGRIVIRADDALPLPEYLVSHRNVETSAVFSPAQADRIVRYVRRIAPEIDTLLIHCVAGIGRSAAAGISIARAYGLPWEQWTQPPYDPNPYILRTLDAAFSDLKTLD